MFQSRHGKELKNASLGGNEKRGLKWAVESDATGRRILYTHDTTMTVLCGSIVRVFLMYISLVAFRDTNLLGWESLGHPVQDILRVGVAVMPHLRYQTEEMICATRA